VGRLSSRIESKLPACRRGGRISFRVPGVELL
jgi:hypothetical protein